MDNAIRVASWDDFIHHIRGLRETHESDPRLSGRLLFRGQSNSGWHLETTLDRATNGNVPFSEYYRTILLARAQIESFTEHRWDLPDLQEVSREAKEYEFLQLYSELHTRIYSYLAHLRHHGFPSPLLDWTRSPYIAAFFAFESATEKDVSIYVLSESSMHSGSSEEACLNTLGPNVRTHKRHFIQQCEYSLCLNYHDGEWWTDEHENAVQVGSNLKFPDQKYPANSVICKINIPASERCDVLETLDEQNINAFTLYGSEESLMKTLAFRLFRYETQAC